ncbi:MAG: NlpC/P60 family protein [Filifactor alocis]|nr:NlpC/P60 family protein [Filifactor alocis]
MSRQVGILRRLSVAVCAGVMLMTSTVYVNASGKEGPYYVKADDVEVYYSGGSEHVVSVVSKGEPFILEEKGEEYSKILLENGLSGYILTEALSEEETKATAEDTASRGMLLRDDSDATKHDRLIDYAKSLLGSPYSYGSRGPKRFDCSGFVGYSYEKSLGIKLPRDSRSMSKVGMPVKKSELVKGDLVFFNTAGGKRITHVGIYIGDGKFIHASSSKVRKVTISDLDSGYYSSRYNTARRIMK